MKNRAFFFSALCYFIALICILPIKFYEPLGGKLDGSWQLGLQWAVQQQLHFGTDIAFTYGPLGVLCTRLPVFLSKWRLLFFDVCFYASLIVALFHLMKRLTTQTEKTALVLTCLAFGEAFNTTQLVVVLFCLLMQALFAHIESEKISSLLYGGFVAIVLFFMKLNLGLYGLLCFYACIAFRLYCAPQKRKYLLTFLASLVLLKGAAILLTVDIIPYLMSSVHLVSGFSEAMYMELNQPEYFLWLAVLVCLGVAIGLLQNIRILFAERWQLFKAVILCGFIFLLFKQAFVRADGHIYAFSQFILLPLGIWYVYALSSMRKVAGSMFLLGVLGSTNMLAPKILPDYLPGRVTATSNYVREVSEPNSDIVEPKPTLPDEILFKLRKSMHSVDVIPWDIASLLYAKLNYTPRPVFQSYAAYDGYLDKLNATKFEGQSAPNTVLFSTHCIDDNYCFFNETLTKLALVTNYRVVSALEHVVVLERRKDSIPLSIVPLEPQMVRLGDEVALPDDRLVYRVRINIRYSLLGKLRNFLYQPPKVKIEISDVQGVKSNFRGIVPILREGVIVGPYIRDFRQAEMFFSGATEFIPRMKSLRIYSEDTWGLKPEIELHWERIDGISSVAKATLQELVPVWEPNGSIRRKVGIAVLREKRLYVRANTRWRHHPDLSNSLILVSDETKKTQLFSMNSDQAARQWGTSESLVDVSSLDVGVYRLGICVQAEGSNSKECYAAFDEFSSKIEIKP